MQWSNLVHGDISVNTVIINPSKHEVSLMGGWWYSKKIGEKLTSMPMPTFKILPNSVIHDKIAKMEIVSEQIHALGRELLGNRYGNYIELSKVNKKFAEWATNPGTDSLYDEYDTWDTKTLNSIFGPRKFIKWDLKSEEVYK